jgi:Dyp-type peroxidase family
MAGGNLARIMAQAVSEYQDIQGIVRSGYGRLGEACFLLLRIADAGQAKAWLSAIVEAPGANRLAYRVTHAGDFAGYLPRALQVAFTAPGTKRLGVPEVLFHDDSTHAFPREFRLGMAGDGLDPEGHSRRLGDVGVNAPSNWEWGGGQAQTPDVLVMLYAETGSLAAFQAMVMADLASGFEVLRVLGTAKTPDDGKVRREPFGFVDGISQPEIDWNARRTPGTSADLEYGNLIAAGEFLLGYQNEYGLYTQRPALDPLLDPDNVLQAADDNTGLHDLGRNGCYLVFRHLEQDVSGFWSFVQKHSSADGGTRLAEAMVGRRLDTGDPLVTARQADIRGIGQKAEDIRQNGFTFDADPEGLTCPFGAHIRRANPRSADLPGGRQNLLSWLLRTLGLKHGGPRDDLISSSRFHRIIRRGRRYGTVADDPSGIYFICLNANIARQFEFIQNAWIVNAKFNGMDREADPLLGNRVPFPNAHPTDTFSWSQPSGPTSRIAGLPQFVTVRGGAYFFLPGLRALRFLAR